MTRATGERLVTAIDGRVERLIELARLVRWPAAYGIALGAAAFAALHPSRASQLAHNAVTPSEGLEMLPWCVGGLVVFAAIYGVALARGDRDGAPAEVVAPWNARLRFVLALPLVAALAWPDWSVAGTLAFVAVAALAVAATVYHLPSAPLAPPVAPVTWERLAAPAAVLVVFAWFTWFFGQVALTNYRALGTRTIDLGLYDNLFWHTAHGDWLGSSYLKGGHHGSAHFDPILVLLSPLYRLRPAADTLLVLQVAWVGSTVVPVYLFARDELDSPRCGVAFAAMVAAHPAVQGAALYEFHSLTLATPLLVWLLYFLQREQYRRYALVLGLTLLCREDLALLVGFVGAYAVLRGGRKSFRAGWMTALAGLVYFTVVKRRFMDSPDLFNTGQGSYGFSYYYADLIPSGNGVAGMATSLLTNPAFVLKTVLAAPKVEYVAILLLPLAGLPLLARTARVTLAYGLAFCLLASKPAVYSIGFQYSCVLLPLAFPVAAIALRQAAAWPIVTAQTSGGVAPFRFALDPARLRRALLAFMLVASALCSWRLGAVDPGHPFYAGYLPLTRALDEAAAARYAWVGAAIARIPPDASVAASPKLGPFISNRREAYEFPTPHTPDFVLLDEADLLGPRSEPPRVDVRPLLDPELVEIDRRGPLVLYSSRLVARAGFPPVP